MRKVIEYDYEPVERVNKKLAEGWQPWGSPFASPGESYCFYQAIVKYESEGGEAASDN